MITLKPTRKGKRVVDVPVPLIINGPGRDFTVYEVGGALEFGQGALFGLLAHICYITIRTKWSPVMNRTLTKILILVMLSPVGAALADTTAFDVDPGRPMVQLMVNGQGP